MAVRESSRHADRVSGWVGDFTAGLLIGLVAGVLTLAAGWLALRHGAASSWYLSRATGTVAYFLLSAATIWGLVLSSKIIKEGVPAPLALGLHSFLSWLALALAGLHGGLLLFDRYYQFGLADILIPFRGPYRPFWTGLGIAGFYLGLLTSASFSWRRRLGQRFWRALHSLTFLAYLLVTVHGLAAGTDSGATGMRLLYVASGLAVLFLVNYRLLSSSVSRR
ncbi:MAG: ferric reductase-like transmembrane domain-containing protein [Anaerolineae bacterium]|nr:ferric reductase-like transmembrane domain-containing protein [Anaerolineae bacterium]